MPKQVCLDALIAFKRSQELAPEVIDEFSNMSMCQLTVQPYRDTGRTPADIFITAYENEKAVNRAIAWIESLLD